MAYTELQKRKNINQEIFKHIGGEKGPNYPQYDMGSKIGTFDLKTAVEHFFHESCEDLNFSDEDKKDGQIPYNMQRDIDRLCFVNAITRFLESGSAHDAFDVYFCYLEVFVGSYGKSRRMIELLSEFESNSSSLLMKHRDHYSHSVFVFALGVAIFEVSVEYRKAYENRYRAFFASFSGKEKEKIVAHHFLRYWGLSSLFHDIGYPFELPFEQVSGYFEDRNANEDFVKKKKREGLPFLAYKDLEAYTSFDEKDERWVVNAKKVLNRLFPQKEFHDLEEVFAYSISQCLDNEYDETMQTISAMIYKKSSNEGFKDYIGAEDYMLKILKHKPTHPDYFNYFMDHAYFSSIVLARELFEEMEPEVFTAAHIDSLTAIVLHNSLYKFSIADWKNFTRKTQNKPFDKALHPLAYMLMLCDELQCWDRTAYGRNSRSELHPMEADMELTSSGIKVIYYFDEKEQKKIDDFKMKYHNYKNDMDLLMNEKDKAEWKRHNPEPRLKAFSKMVNENEFLKDIEAIVDLKDINITVELDLKPSNNNRKGIFLSNSNFIHLYHLATVLNARYNKEEETEEEMQNSFDNLSLEYKLSNILQAKGFAKHLDCIGCFYTDRPVAYEMVESFTDSELIRLGEREHKRWEEEKYSMFWIPAGEMSEIISEDKTIREITRMHKDLGTDFSNLDDETKAKDMHPLNVMLKKLNEYNGLRFYRYKDSGESSDILN